ncbi:hypothetical protein WMF04_24605 [Sorangium sp. So ce260]|uniref:hypothetical protein n=1 Tax=Sorangium sp. So ce260 TaxID=3133291 RepID=UPI003F5E3108
MTGEPVLESALTAIGPRGPVYRGKEAVALADIDARADLSSLGVLAFELLTGRPPFVGDASAVVHAHVSRRPPRIRSGIRRRAPCPRIRSGTRSTCGATRARSTQACSAASALRARSAGRVGCFTRSPSP